MAVSQITVTGSYDNQDGTPASGRVAFRLSTALVDSAGNTIVAPALKTVDLVNGAFSITLAATNDPSIEPSGATYTVTEVIDGASYNGNRHRSYAVEIPYDALDATVDLADLAPVEDATITYGVTQAAFSAHTADTTSVHGIADTSLLATTADLTDFATTDDLASLASDADLSAHASDTTAVHGISDTAALVALLTRWEIDVLLVSGGAMVASDVAPPGLRIPRATTLTDLILRAGTAPSGDDLTVAVQRAGVDLATVTVAAGETEGETTDLAITLNTNDVLTFDVTAVGIALTPGADIALSLIGA